MATKPEPKTAFEAEREKYELPPEPYLNCYGKDTRPAAINNAPWFKHMMSVFVDASGVWCPTNSVVWYGECRGCGGSHETYGEPPKFCPWCANELDILQAKAFSQSHEALPEWTERFRQIIREDFPHLVTDISHSDEA